MLPTKSCVLGCMILTSMQGNNNSHQQIHELFKLNCSESENSNNIRNLDKRTPANEKMLEVSLVGLTSNKHIQDQVPSVYVASTFKKNNSEKMKNCQSTTTIQKRSSDLVHLRYHMGTDQGT